MSPHAFLRLLGIVMDIRARDLAARCPICQQIVVAEAEKCPNCASAITHTFTLAEQRAAWPVSSPADHKTFWWIAVGTPAVLGLAVFLSWLVVSLMEHHDAAEAAAAAAESAASRRPATSAAPASAEVSAEAHRFAIDRAEAAAAAAARASEQPAFPRDTAVMKAPGPPASPWTRTGPRPTESALAGIGARQRARYDEEARLAAQRSDAEPQARIETQASVAELGHRVVLRDGSAVASKDAPRLAGNVVIFTDLRNRLVSMRSSEVDLRATEAANGVVLRPPPP